jgi:hypothetical protein
MKELLDEYGGIVIGASAAVLLLLLVTGLVFGGDIYNAIQGFSQRIC